MLIVLVCSMSVGDVGPVGNSGPASLAFVSGVFPSLGDDGGLAAGYQLPEFADKVDPAYRCSSCGKVLIQPRQTTCGHRVCATCINQLTEKYDSQPFHCPANEDGCEDMTIDQAS